MALQGEHYKALKKVLFDVYDYVPHEQAVADFHNSDARTKVVSCPARTSKSFAGWKDALPDVYAPGIELSQGAQAVEPFLCWIVGPNYDLAKEFDYAWDDLVMRPRRLGLDYSVRRKKNDPRQGNMVIEILWGTDSRGIDVTSTVEVKSAFNEKSLQSEEVDLCIMSEAARLPETVWSKYLSTRTKRSIWPTTPDAQAAWIWRMIQHAAGHSEFGTESFQFTGRANPRYDWERYWVEHAKAESRVEADGVTAGIETHPSDNKLPPSPLNGHDCFDEMSECKAMKDDGFAEQFGGLWVFHRGRVVPLREEASRSGAPSHVIDHDPDWMRHAVWTTSSDYGFKDPAVTGFWATGPGARQHILRRCVYERGLTPEAFVERTLYEWNWICEEFGISRTFPHRMLGDPQKPEVEQIMRDRGLPIWNVDKAKQRSRAAGHQELMSRLAVDSATGEPGLLVHSDCKSVIREWRELVYSERASSEDSTAAFKRKVADDAYDMARYFVSVKPAAPEVIPGMDTFASARREVIRQRSRVERKRKATVPQGRQPIRWAN